MRLGCLKGKNADEFCFVTWLDKKHYCDTLRIIHTTIEKVDGKRQFKKNKKSKSLKDFADVKTGVIADALYLIDNFDMEGYEAWLEEKKLDPIYHNDRFKKE